MSEIISAEEVALRRVLKKGYPDLVIETEGEKFHINYRGKNASVRVATIYTESRFAEFQRECYDSTYRGPQMRSLLDYFRAEGYGINLK